MELFHKLLHFILHFTKISNMLPGSTKYLTTKGSLLKCNLLYFKMVSNFYLHSTCFSHFSAYLSFVELGHVAGPHLWTFLSLIHCWLDNFVQYSSTGLCNLQQVDLCIPDQAHLFNSCLVLSSMFLLSRSCQQDRLFLFCRPSWQHQLFFLGRPHWQHWIILSRPLALSHQHNLVLGSSYVSRTTLSSSIYLAGGIVSSMEPAGGTSSSLAGPFDGPNFILFGSIAGKAGFNRVKTFVNY